MNKKLQWTRGATWVVLILMQAQAYASCGSAACTINTQWDQGKQQPGLMLDLRYEYIDQDQLREGLNKTSNGAGEALEKRTINRNLIGTLDYTFNENWGVAFSVPYVNRDHMHMLNDTLEYESWNYSKMGDVRVIGRYQPTAEPFQNLDYGIKFGTKLPTGATDITNADNKMAERALQPGTGSTDIVLGAYIHQTLPDSSGGWFMQAMLQHAVTTIDRFTPGDQIGIDLGLNYRLSDKWGALLQLNALHKESDMGANAEPDLSGGLSVFLSPGLSYAIGLNSQIYGFIQKPVYQYVNGVQLTADMTAAVGLRQHF